MMFMKQDELWIAKFQDVVTFIETNKRNPSKHNDEERGRCLNWIKHNKMLYTAGALKEDRAEKFRALMELSETYRHVNQWK